MSWTVLAFRGDPLDPRYWSGTPFGLYSALKGRGLAVPPPHRGVSHPVDIAVKSTALARWALEGGLPPHRLRQLLTAYHDTANSYLPWLLASRIAERRVARRPEITDVICCGGAMHHFPARVRLVTYEDVTVPQLAANPIFWTSRIPRRDLNRLINFMRHSYERATVCCVFTPWVKTSLIEDFGVDPAKIAVVGLGSNRTPQANTDRPWESPHFLLVGTPWALKNGPMVLRAFERVRREIPHARLSVVGDAPSDERPGVTFHGVLPLGDPPSQARLAEITASATCFVMPSMIECAGIAYVEAMAAGLPAIGTKCGGASHVVGPGGTCVDPHSEDELVAAMLRFTDPETAQATSLIAVEHAAQFTWDKVIDRLLDAVAAAPARAA